MADTPVSPPRSWGRSTVQTACPLDCPDCVQPRRHRRARPDRARSTATTARRRPTATSAARCGASIGACISEERLLHPAVRKGPKGTAEFARVTWDEALDLIAAKMQRRARRVRRRVRAALLLRRLERPAHQRPRGRAVLPPLRRVAAGAHACAPRRPARPRRRCTARWPASPTPTTKHARLIIVWGCNPSATGIHLVSHIKRAQKHGREARRDRSAPHAARAPGRPAPGRAARARTCRSRSRSMRELFERGRADEAFLAAHATGAERTARRPPSRGRSIARPRKPASPPPTSRTVAEWYGTISPAVIRCGWGQERNRNGGASTMAILALPAVAGKFGVRGGGYTMSNSAAWGITAGAAHRRAGAADARRQHEPSRAAR